MSTRPVPVYIPTKKITIIAPQIMKKLAFQLNYKNLKTTKLEIDGEVAIIQFHSFEAFRRCLKRWQRKENDADERLWRFLQDHVMVEMVLSDVDTSEPKARQDQPYLALLRFNVSQIDQFASLFHAAQFKRPQS
jgi:hypothetical protein